MPTSITARLAWTLWALCLACWGAALLLLTATDPAALPEQLLFAPAILGFPTVGVLIATRRPDNAIGWLFCLVPLLTVFGLFAEQYFLYAVALRPDALPAAVLVAWLGNWLGSLGWGSIWTFPLLLFPTGRLPSSRWRPIAWGIGAVMALFTAAQAFKPGPLHERTPAVPNPFGLASFAGLFTALEEMDWLFLVVVLACAASVLLRFRTARGEERQQLKWFAAAAALLLGAALLAPAMEHDPTWATISGVLVALALAGVPAAAGVAILRYRLYDIDLLINRALVYGTLTGLLALIYLSGVVLLQSLFRALTGQGSTLAIVVATLLSAAFFQPLRGRVQRVIDRRFYRRRYDAARTLATFSARLRDEVDLATLTDELVRVTDETLQPSHVSLWMRAPPRSGAGNVAEQNQTDGGTQTR